MLMDEVTKRLQPCFPTPHYNTLSRRKAKMERLHITTLFQLGRCIGGSTEGLNYMLVLIAIRRGCNITHRVNLTWMHFMLLEMCSRMIM